MTSGEVVRIGALFKQRCVINGGMLDDSCMFSSSKKGQQSACLTSGRKEDHYETNFSHNKGADFASILAHSQTTG